MHRPTLGLIAVVLLGLGFYLHAPGDDAIASACLRIGLVMAVWWFAAPQMKNVPRWVLIVGGVALFIILRWPKLIVLALPVLIVLWLLRPRAPRQARDRSP